MDNDSLDSTIVALLAGLHAAGRDDAARPATMARLSKRVGLPMSTLRRSLAALEGAGLVALRGEPEYAALTVAGEALCAALWPAGDTAGD